MRHDHARGFTAVELMVSLTLMTIMFGGVVMASQRGIALFRQSAVISEINGRSARVMDRLTREILNSGGTTFLPDLSFEEPDPPPWSQTLDFCLAEGWAANAVAWGPAQRILAEIEPGEVDNGVDDDGDGLVDELRIVLVRNPDLATEQRTVLVSGVSEFLEGETANGLDDNGNDLVDEAGFCFDLADDRLTFRVTLQRVGPTGRMMLRTQAVSLSPRN